MAHSSDVKANTVHSRLCLYCSSIFVPKTKRSIMCGSEECKKKRKIETQRKRYEDPGYREKMNEYYRKRREDPEVREKDNEYQRKRREDPEVREKMKEYQRKRRQKNKE